MSYILDALKKADRERSRVKVPTLTTVHVPVYGSRRWIVPWLAAAILVGGGATAWFLWPAPPDPLPIPAPSRPSVEAPPAVETATPQREPAAPPPVAAPTAESAAPESRVEARQGGARESAPQAPHLRPEPPKSRQERRPIGVLPPASSGVDRTMQTGRLPASPAAEPRVRPEANTARADGAPSPPDATAGNAPTLRDILAKMTLDVFVYSESETDRMAVINGRRYVKGQRVDGLYLVEDIVPEGVVLSYRGEQATLKP